MKKMKENRSLVFLAFLLIIGSVAFAQVEEITPMYINHTLAKQKNQTQHSSAKLSSVNSVSLPFFDDFSYQGPYPDPNKWENSQTVFVNQNFPLNPRNVGVATFDGLKSNGYPHNVTTSIGSWPSDTLLSQPINLDSSIVLPSDSVYLSFYFQSKGLAGDAPEPGDVLTLELYNPTTGTWPTTANYTMLRPNNNPKFDSDFTRVMIPVNNPQYFEDGFRFRFRNKSTRNGSVDLWHIDEIYLNSGRSAKDTVFEDVAMVYEAKSLLKKFTGMPFRQYAATDMDTQTQLTVRDNDTNDVGVNITGYTEIYDNAGTLVFSQNNGSGDVFPYYNFGYCNVGSIANPSFSYVYNNGASLTDSTSYKVKHYIKTSFFDKSKANDTILYKQVFNNYFSYDDGTAEAGYQLRAYDAQLGVRFPLIVQDTLQAIDICFNPVPGYDCNSGNSASPGSVLNLTFGLRVWNDNGGQPGSILYADSFLMPVYTSNIYYPFFRFKLKTPLLLGPGTYYYGMKQDDCNPINVGYDFNTNTQGEIFYNVGAGWNTSSFAGSVMIRAIFGDSILAIDNIQEQYAQQHAFSNLIVYPNPADNICYFSLGKTGNNRPFLVEIYDALGKKLHSETISDKQGINTSDLQKGFYFARVIQDNKVMATRKIIISR
jgi:hypothetical protein